MGERCTVEGTVQSIIFQNEENGYTVLSLLTDEGELVTVVGCIPCAAPGEGMTVTGVWVNHPSYGPQLTAEQVDAPAAAERGGADLLARLRQRSRASARRRRERLVASVRRGYAARA